MTGFIPIRSPMVYGSQTQHKISDKIPVYVIRAKEINSPEGVEAIDWLGKLGGFMNRKKDKLPGIMTLWRSYENLMESLIMLNLSAS